MQPGGSMNTSCPVPTTQLGRASPPEIRISSEGNSEPEPEPESGPEPISATPSDIPSSEEGIQRIFSEAAVLHFEDGAIGAQVEDMRMKGFPIESADGLDFCKVVLDDERIQGVLKTMLSQSVLGIYEVYRLDARYTYACMTGLNQKLTAILVQLFSPKSCMQVYTGSNLLPVRGIPSSSGLLEIPYASIKSCNPLEVKLEKGGLAILDARLAFKVEKGFAFHFVFATKEEIRTWRRKIFPHALAKKSSEIETSTIGLNFAFNSS